MADQRIIYSEEMVGASHPTKSDTLNRLALVEHNNDGTHEKLSVGSDADGDMYYRASGVLARLAKGAANLKLFMNAGATAPEWAAGYKLGSFTRDMAAVAGDVAYTGVGFKPVLVEFMTSFSQAHSVGWDDGTNAFYSATVGVGTGMEYISGGARSIFMTDNYGSTNVLAYIKTLDSDGFTLTWSKTGSPTGTFTVYYKAYR
jgi:hypothetical protein